MVLYVCRELLYTLTDQGQTFCDIVVRGGVGNTDIIFAAITQTNCWHSSYTVVLQQMHCKRHAIHTGSGYVHQNIKRTLGQNDFCLMACSLSIIVVRRTAKASSIFWTSRSVWGSSSASIIPF